MTDSLTAKSVDNKGSRLLVIIAVLVAVIWSCSQVTANLALAVAAPDQLNRYARIAGYAAGSGAVIALVVILVLYVLCAILKRNIGWAGAIFVALAAVVPAGVAPVVLDMLAAPFRAEKATIQRNFQEANAKERAQYMEALNLGTLTGCLEPDSLKRGLDMKVCRERIQVFRDGSVGILLLAQAAPADVEKYVAKSKLSPANQRKILIEFNDDYAVVAAKFEHDEKARSRIADDVEALLVNLDRSRGAWSVEGQRVIFARQADLDAYTSGMARLTKSINALAQSAVAGGRVESPVIRPQADQPIEPMRPH